MLSYDSSGRMGTDAKISEDNAKLSTEREKRLQHYLSHQSQQCELLGDKGLENESKLESRTEKMSRFDDNKLH